MYSQSPTPYSGTLSHSVAHGPIKLWKERFVTLDEGTLSIFKKTSNPEIDQASTQNLVGSMNLLNCSIVPSKRSEIVHIAGILGTVSSKQKDVKFMISDTGDRGIWLTKLNEHMDFKKRLGTPLEASSPKNQSSKPRPAFFDTDPETGSSDHITDANKTPKPSKTARQSYDRDREILPEAASPLRPSVLFTDIFPTPIFTIQSAWPTGEKVYINVCDYGDFPEMFKLDNSRPYMLSSPSRMELDDVTPLDVHDDGVWIYDVLVDSASLQEFTVSDRPSSLVMHMMHAKQCKSPRDLLCVCVLDQIKLAHNDRIGPAFHIVLDLKYKGERRMMRVPFEFQPRLDRISLLEVGSTPTIALNRYCRKVPYRVLDLDGAKTYSSPHVTYDTQFIKSVPYNEVMMVYARRRVNEQQWVKSSDGWAMEKDEDGNLLLQPTTTNKRARGVDVDSLQFHEFPKEENDSVSVFCLYNDYSTKIDLIFQLNILFGKDGVVTLSRTLEAILFLKHAIDESPCDSLKYAKKVYFPENFTNLTSTALLENPDLIISLSERIGEWIDEVVQLVDIDSCTCDEYLQFFDITPADAEAIARDLASNERGWTYDAVLLKSGRRWYLTLAEYESLLTKSAQDQYKRLFNVAVLENFSLAELKGDGGAPPPGADEGSELLSSLSPKAKVTKRV